MPTSANTFRRYLAAVGLVALSTAAAEILYRLTGTTRLSMVFLAGVLLAGARLGSGPAYLAAALAFLIYIYLVDPRFRFEFGSPEDFLTLVVFLAVAMLTGNLTGRVRDEAKRAQARAQTTGVLFDASQEFSASSDEQHIRARLAHHLAAAARGEAALLESESSRPATEGWTLRPLQAHGATLGVAAWRPAAGRLDEGEQTLLEILADTGAAAIARARLAAAKAEAETRARTEDLRNALLSSISHDLRTPLAAIIASASSLQTFGDSFDAGVRADLTTTIQEEAERLNAYVANLLNMTRLEAGALAVQRITFSLPEVVERSAARGRRRAKRGVALRLDGDLPEALGDPVLLEQALDNVLENALRFTPAGRAVSVAAEAGEGVLKVEVADEGPGVPPEDLTRIFEKFFRSEATRQRPGAGLGLSITKGLVEGMGGSVSARPRDDGRSGLVVKLIVPAATP